MPNTTKSTGSTKLAKERNVQSIYDELRRLKEKVEERDLTIRQLKRENQKTLVEKSFEVRQFKRETQKAKEEKDFEARQRKRESEDFNKRIRALTLERNDLITNLAETQKKFSAAETNRQGVFKELNHAVESLKALRQDRQHRAHCH